MYPPIPPAIKLEIRRNKMNKILFILFIGIIVLKDIIKTIIEKTIPTKTPIDILFLLEMSVATRLPMNTARGKAK